MTYRQIITCTLIAFSITNGSAYAAEPAELTSSALVQMAPAKLTQMTNSVTVYGTVEYSPEASRILDVQAESIISRVMVAAGQRVRKGDSLLELMATVNARSELENAQIGVSFASKDLQRLEDLRSRQLATNLEVQTAEETLAKASAALANTQKRQGGSNVRILRSEFDGVVDQVNVRQGETVAAGAPLIRLAKGDQLRARFGIEPEDLLRIHEGLAVDVIPLHDGAEPSKGRLQQIYRQIDPKTGLAEAVVLLKAAQGLLPGAVVKGAIIISQRLALTVPRSAVLTRSGKHYLFVDKNKHASLRWVEIGEDDGKSIAIQSGIKQGEMVVSLGNYELQEGMLLRVQGQQP